MEQTQTLPAPTKEKTGGLIHLAGRHEGVALCGTKITGLASAGKEKCLVCLEFTKRDWSVR